MDEAGQFIDGQVISQKGSGLIWEKSPVELVPYQGPLKDVNVENECLSKIHFFIRECKQHFQYWILPKLLHRLVSLEGRLCGSFSGCKKLNF